MSSSAVRMGRAFVEIGADPKKLFSALNKINAQIGKVGRSMTSIGTKLSAVGASIAAPLALATRTFATFDDAIRATAAVTGATGTALQSLNDTARKLGETTSFTAVQVANLMTELGRAGFSPDQINVMTGAVLDLARATGTDATLASGIMAAAIRQFSLGAGDAARVADVLTKAANATFNTVEGLGESLKYAGPVAQSLGMSLEDTVAVLGVLGNVGIQGAEAGTALRRLSVIAAGSGEKLQELFGVSNQDAAGNLKPMIQVLDEINTATANMPVAERTAKMAEAFGLLGITSANVLSQTAGGVRGLAEELQNAEGTAARTAQQMDAGLGGAMRIAMSAIEGTALSIGDALAPAMTAIVQQITALAGGFTKFVKENQALIVTIAQVAAGAVAAGVALMATGAAVSLLSGVLGGVLAVSGTVVAAFAGIASVVLSLGMTFVGAVASVISYGAVSIATAVASGAAWVIANAPLILLVGLLGAAAAFAFQAIGGFEGIGNAIGGGMNDAISGGVSLFGDLAKTGKEALGGIYDALADGDLAGAMDILWAGLYAAWLRGSEAIMGPIDSWVAFLQNTFTYMAASITGIFGDLVNGVMNMFDSMIVAVQKSWNYVQSFIKRGFNLAKENNKVQSEADARKAARSAARGSDTAMEEADRIAEGRLNTNEERAAGRRAASAAADQAVSGKAGAAKESRARNEQFADLLKSIEGTSTLSQLRGHFEEFDALSSNGRLTSSQASTIEAALEDAQERLSKSGSSSGGRASPSSRAASVSDGASVASGASSRSSAEVAGSFSANVSGMGFGANLAQKQLDTLKAIEQNTRDMDEGSVAA
jgi:TP901 family phage tail tape measure protein